MPWPVTHILVVEKVYPRYFNHLERKEFILGTSFPDIRYPAGIDRDQTHFNGISLSKIITKPAFEAGLYFHSFVDEVWNTFIRAHETQLFPEIPHNRAMFHTMKILQDRYLYDRFDDWQTIENFFDKVLPIESQFTVSQEMVQHWHAVLARYLSKPPDIGDLAMLRLSLSAELVNKIAVYYRKYQDNQALKHVMTSFYEQAESLIQKAY